MLTVRSRSEVYIEAPVEQVFAWFEDPQSMLHLPGCVEASGTLGPAGTGLLRFDTTEESTTNRWRVLSFEKNRKSVIQQSLETVYHPSGKAAHIEIVETNIYRPKRSGCLLVRKSKRTWPKYHGPVPPGIYKWIRDNDQSSLDRLARTMRSAADAPVRVPDPPSGFYLNEG